jgi:predicted RNA-binding protein with PIN domain
MQFLVDGHNLIPKLGLRLDSLDDEADLIARLQEFCCQRRAQVEVYFDGAPPGHPSVRKAGAVTAHFVRKGATADAAIEVRLAKLGKQARNWTVVSSDGRVQRAAGAAHAAALSSDEFAGAMAAARTAETLKAKTDTGLSPEEVEQWLEAFEKRGKTN